MNKFTRILAPLALVASMIAPSLAHAATVTESATTSAQSATPMLAKTGNDAIAKWHREPDRFYGRQPVLVVRPPVYAPPVYAPPVRVMPRYDYGQRFEHGHHFGYGQRFENGRGGRW